MSFIFSVRSCQSVGEVPAEPECVLCPHRRILISSPSDGDAIFSFFMMVCSVSVIMILYLSKSVPPGTLAVAVTCRYTVIPVQVYLKACLSFFLLPDSSTPGNCARKS